MLTLQLCATGQDHDNAEWTNRIRVGLATDGVGPGGSTGAPASTLSAGRDRCDVGSLG
jgi:hypothetical protein